VLVDKHREEAPQWWS